MLNDGRWCVLICTFAVCYVNPMAAEQCCTGYRAVSMIYQNAADDAAQYVFGNNAPSSAPSEPNSNCSNSGWSSQNCPTSQNCYLTNCTLGNRPWISASEAEETMFYLQSCLQASSVIQSQQRLSDQSALSCKNSALAFRPPVSTTTSAGSTAAGKDSSSSQSSSTVPAPPPASLCCSGVHTSPSNGECTGAGWSLSTCQGSESCYEINCFLFGQGTYSRNCMQSSEASNKVQVSEQLNMECSLAISPYYAPSTQVESAAPPSAVDKAVTSETVTSNDIQHQILVQGLCSAAGAIILLCSLYAYCANWCCGQPEVINIEVDAAQLNRQLRALNAATPTSQEFPPPERTQGYIQHPQHFAAPEAMDVAGESTIAVGSISMTTNQDEKATDRVIEAV